MYGRIGHLESGWKWDIVFFFFFSFFLFPMEGCRAGARTRNRSGTCGYLISIYSILSTPYLPHNRNPTNNPTHS